jgi:hypothetical protein
MAHADPDPGTSWVPSRKLVYAVTANLLTAGAAYAAARTGLHLSAGESAIIPGLIGVASGAVAGYAVREVPVLEKDVAAHP